MTFVVSSISYGPTDLSLGAVHKRRWPLGGVKNWSQLLTDSTKKLPIWGRGMSKTSFMDGPIEDEIGNFALISEPHAAAKLRTLGWAKQDLWGLGAES